MWWVVGGAFTLHTPRGIVWRGRRERRAGERGRVASGSCAAGLGFVLGVAVCGGSMLCKVAPSVLMSCPTYATLDLLMTAIASFGSSTRGLALVEVGGADGPSPRHLLLKGRNQQKINIWCSCSRRPLVTTSLLCAHLEFVIAAPPCSAFSPPCDTGQPCETLGKGAHFARATPVLPRLHTPTTQVTRGARH